MQKEETNMSTSVPVKEKSRFYHKQEATSPERLYFAPKVGKALVDFHTLSLC